MITVSIISHNQLFIIKNLLKELFNNSNIKIILTINIREDESVIKRYINNDRLLIIRNFKVKGFGENHNHAFSLSDSEYFMILNPDVIVDSCIFDKLLHLMQSNNLSVLAPISIDRNNNILDNARKFPKFYTPLVRLFNRKNDYDLIVSKIYNVDWVSGMCILFRKDLFVKLSGFDRRYFLYYEDVDICKRIHSLGYNVNVTSEVSLKHIGNRLSKKTLKYFLIHIASLLKYHFKHGFK